MGEVPRIAAEDFGLVSAARKVDMGEVPRIANKRKSLGVATNKERRYKK